MKSIFYFLLIVLFGSCTDESPSNCDQHVKVSDSEYDKGPDDFLQFVSVTLSGECLIIEYSASGCNGQNWEEMLLASSAVAESFPVQRYIRLSLDNPEDCLAVFTKTVSFDLGNIQLDEYDTIILNLQDYDQQIRYEY